jgi:hypothetical protein
MLRDDLGETPRSPASVSVFADPFCALPRDDGPCLPFENGARFTMHEILTLERGSPSSANPEKAAGARDQLDLLNRLGLPQDATEEDDSRDGHIYAVILRPDLETPDVVAMIHYVTDFGAGSARGHAVDSGWSIRLTRMSDIQLLASQYPDLIEDCFRIDPADRGRGGDEA